MGAGRALGRCPWRRVAGQWCPGMSLFARPRRGPDGGAGVSEQLPPDERHLYREDYLTDTLAVRLGGRADELVEFGQGSTGRPTTWPAAPIWPPRWSAACRPRWVRSVYPEGGSVFLGGGSGFSSRPFAEAHSRWHLLLL